MLVLRKQLTVHTRSLKVTQERFGDVEDFFPCNQRHTGKLTAIVNTLWYLHSKPLFKQS